LHRNAIVQPKPIRPLPPPSSSILKPLFRPIANNREEDVTEASPLLTTSTTTTLIPVESLGLYNFYLQHIAAAATHRHATLLSTSAHFEANTISPLASRIVEPSGI